MRAVMLDGLSWSAAVLVVLSVAVAVVCARLPEPELTPARALESGEPAARTSGRLLPATHRGSSDIAPGTCAFGEVVLIAARQDPARSTAAVRLLDGTTTTRKRGQSVAGHVVETVATEHVVFERAGVRCTLFVGGPATALAPRSGAAGARASDARVL